MNRNKYKKQYLKWHRSYEKRSNTILKRVFRDWIRDIKWSNLNQSTYKAYLLAAFDEDKLTEAYLKIYREIGLVHGKRTIKETARRTKALDIASFITLFERNLAIFMRDFAGVNIRSVRTSLIESITNLLSKRIDGGMTMREAAIEVEKIVNKPRFYRWRALRIARTESTAASNFATLQGSNVTGFVMVKEWISTADNRTRRRPEDKYDHFVMDGKKIDVDDEFVFNNGAFVDKLRFPGDPKGSPANIINCRCTIALVAKRDKDGNLIRK